MADERPFGPVVIVVSREEVEHKVQPTSIDALKTLVSSPDRAREYFGQVDIAFHGYNADSRELYEIPEVRQFVYEMDTQFPYWLFFLNKQGLGLQCIALCFLPPYLTEAAKQTVWPERLERLLMDRWFPAMNHICAMVGFSNQQVEHLSDEVCEYFANGPQRG